MSSRSLLFLTHRMPAPPDKGDKIRNHHVLTALADYFDIHLVTFTAPDETVPDSLRNLCASITCLPLKPHRLRALLAALVRGCSVTEAVYAQHRYRTAIATVAEAADVSICWAGSSAVAAYLWDLPGRKFVDFMDVDSDKWHQYAHRSRWPWLRWLYHREARRVEALEEVSLARAEAVFVVAEGELELLQARGHTEQVVRVAGNGTILPSPAPAPPGNPHDVVFVGAMDYWPNEDAACWFVAQVWPQIRAEHPHARFVIVGSQPTSAVRQLAQTAGVVVTGSVPSVAPYLDQAAVVVTPLRMARGIQNKVLEGMAWGRAVVTTPQGLDGIDATDGEELLVRESAETTAMAINRLLAHPEQAAKLGRQARLWVASHYTWQQQLQPVLRALNGTPDDPERLGGAGQI